MLFGKGHQPLVGVKEVCDDHITIVITVKVFHTVNSVRFMLRKCRHDRRVLTEQQNGCQRYTLLVLFKVLQNQTGTAKKFFIGHRQPRMIVLADAGHLTRTLNDVGSQGFKTHTGKHLVHIEGVLLLCIELVNEVGNIGNIHIRIVIAVIDPSAAAAHLRTGGNGNADHKTLIVPNILWLKVQRRIDLLRVIDRSNEILFDLVRTGWIYTQYCAVIRNTEENISAVTVGKGADGFVHILCNLLD